MNKLAINWRTSSAGIGALLAAAAYAANSYAHGEPIDYGMVISSVISGIGLLFAKDSNVTGGTKSAVSGETVSQPVSLIG